MKENQNDKRNQDKTSNMSTQKTQQDGTKRETIPNNPTANSNKQQEQQKKGQQEQSKNKPSTQEKGKKGN